MGQEFRSSRTDSGYLPRLQVRCWLGCSHVKTWLEKGDPLPRGLTHMAGRWMLAFGRRTQFLTTWASLQGCLRIMMTGWLASPQGQWCKRGQDRSHKSQTITATVSYRLHRSAPFSMGGYHTGCDCQELRLTGGSVRGCLSQAHSKQQEETARTKALWWECVE